MPGSGGRSRSGDLRGGLCLGPGPSAVLGAAGHAPWAGVPTARWQEDHQLFVFLQEQRLRAVRLT